MLLGLGRGGLRCEQPEMGNRGSDLARGASSSQESGEASAATAPKWEQKSRAPSPVSKGRKAARTETTSAWTGEKKTKTQSTAPSEDLVMIARDDTEHSSGNIVPGQEQGSEQIEGLEWDIDRLWKETDCRRDRMIARAAAAAADHAAAAAEDESWSLDEGQLALLNRRLALYYIKARKPEYRKTDDSKLESLYPVSDYQEYYEHNNHNSEWYFERKYCSVFYSHLQDYQRLVLSDNGQYDDWKCYSNLCNTFEADQQFVQLWERLLSETKLTDLLLKNEQPNSVALILYHTVKIAEGLPHVTLSLAGTAYREFVQIVPLKHKWSKYYAGFFFNMWQLVIKQKMDFEEAMRRIQSEGKINTYTLPFEARSEEHIRRYLDLVGETAEEDEAYGKIMTFAHEFLRRMTYYDYAKKKLGIAEEIGLIPTLGPHKSSL